MALTIYEAVSGGTKKHHPPGGEDWSVLVAARNPAEARDIACHETEIASPWAIYEWGTDARENVKPGVLRGPFENCPAVCRGWKMYHEDLDDPAESPRVVVYPMPPRDENYIAPKNPDFICAQCGKVTPLDTYFTITATGYIELSRSGGSERHSVDSIKLSLWHIADYETRRTHELKLSEGGNANVACCSADCLKKYLWAAVDKLARRTTSS